jgi:hypothetical protein
MGARPLVDGELAAALVGPAEQFAGLAAWAAGITSAAGIRHGSVEAKHGRGVTSVFGPVRVTRMAYRNRREPNLYPVSPRSPRASRT